MDTPRYQIWVNAQAGHVIEHGQKVYRAIAEKHNCLIDFYDPEVLLEEKIKTCRDTDLPILIAGGDGTVKACAQAFMKEKGSFGILPLGTMNLLARDLDIPLSFEDALQAYINGSTEKRIDVGLANDDIFLCCAGLGTIPKSSIYRERQRDQNGVVLIPKLVAYIFDQLEHKKAALDLDIDGHGVKMKTGALLISNNQYNPNDDIFDYNFKRKTLNRGHLSLYTIRPRNFFEKLRLLFIMRWGNWHKEPAIKEYEGKRILIRTESQMPLVSLDGEVKKMKAPLCFAVDHEALLVWVPKKENNAQS